MIIAGTTAHLEELLPMGIDLWPEESPEGLKNIFIELMNKPEKNQFYLFLENSNAVGFIYMSVRNDYVEGSDSSPVGYVEGIYVKPEHRRKGISGKLLKQGEQWAKQKGCTQIGSDIYADNKVSYDFHTAIGFKEAGRLIAFIKEIEK
jgi:aminoglycoside 6'-N-acetyltransferase I